MPPDLHSRGPKNKAFLTPILATKLNLVFAVALLLFFCVSLSECNESPQTEKSLFDSLPLNGALVLDSLESEDKPQIQKISSIKPDDRSKTGTGTTSEPEYIRKSGNHHGNIVKGTSGSSLFDFLPDQGAMIPPSSQIKTREIGKRIGANNNLNLNDTSKNLNSNTNPRTQRHSTSLYSLHPPAPNTDTNTKYDNNNNNNGHFEIEKQIPKSEFSFSVFDSDDIAINPIIKSLTQSQPQQSVPSIEYGIPTSAIHRAIPIIQSSTFNFQRRQPTNSYGGYNNKGNSAQPVPVFRQHQPSAPVRYYQGKGINAVRVPAQESHYTKPSTAAAATSGGSTVIIYAHPGSDKSSNTNQNDESRPHSNAPSFSPPKGSYGVPETTTTTTTTVSPVSKNEVHYHYHINNNNNNKKNKPQLEQEKPSVIYGVPSSAPVPPPRATYGAPNRRPKLRRPFRGKQQNQNGYRNYRPPPTGTETGGYNAQVPQPSKSSHHFGSSDSQQATVPIITGSGSVINQEDFRSSDSFNDDDSQEDNNNENSRHGKDGQENDQENFKQRTLLTYNSYQDSPPQTSKGYSNYNAQPSTSYGPPPVQSYAPSPSYGPAPPATSSPPPPPLEVNDQTPPPFQAQNAQTSITLETIPITTTETRLVTVPKITQTLGSIQNVPTLSDTPLQPPPNNPSAAYGVPSDRSQSHSFSNGPPAPPPSSNRQQATRDILDEQLLQLNPSRGGLSDFPEIEALLQEQQSSQRNNPLLSSLLLDQVSLSNLNSQTRGNGDIILNSRLPLRNSFLLNGHGHGHGHGSGSIGLRNFGGGGGITLNNLPVFAGVSSAGSGHSGGGLNQLGLGGSLRGGGTVLTGDAVGAISDIIREQRLQLAVSDLRHRLRLHNRDAERTRQNNRSLFYKGALLLAGLSLIPTVATVASPLAAGALGLGSSSALSLSSSLLPLTAGRRKRSLQNSIHPYKDVDVDVGVGIDFDVDGSKNNLGLQEENHLKHESSIFKLPNFSGIFQLPGEKKSQTHSLVFRNHKVFNSKQTSGRLESKSSDSLFDSLAFKGALIPEAIQADLEKYLPPSQVIANSECIQRYFCSTLLEIEALPDPSSFLLLIAALTSDVDKNPWLEHALIAARNKSCTSFYCHMSHN